MLIIDRLKNIVTLSEAEKSVANIIIELQEDIKDVSIRELANISFASTSAVTRLCHKIGFAGYPEFKEKYIEEIKYLNSHFDSIDANFPFTKKDNINRVIGSISELYQETAKDTNSLVNYYDFIKAAKLIEKSTNTYILCIGSSIELGKIFADRMMRIGKNIIVSRSVNEQFYQSYNAKDGDCFIVISYSGTTYKTNQFIQNLSHSKAHSILITSIGESQWKDNVDIVLRMTTREKLYTNIASYSTTVSTMLILDMLYSCYFHQNYDENLEHKITLAKEYEPNRKASQRIMEEE